MSEPKKYTIESHIPIPNRSSGRSPREGTSELVETALKMQVGDSFISETYDREKKRPAIAQSNITCILKVAIRKRELPWKFITRTLHGPSGTYSIRVWRIQ